MENEVLDMKILLMYAKYRVKESVAIAANGLRLRWNTKEIIAYDYVENRTYPVTIDQLVKMIEAKENETK